MTRGLAAAVASQHLGVGAMFTEVYSQFDLLVQWWPTEGSVQRLTNAIATGIPVIALTCRAFEEASPLMRSPACASRGPPTED